MYGTYGPVGMAFASFAAACITHAQQDARRAAREKHAPLKFSVPDAKELPSQALTPRNRPSPASSTPRRIERMQT